MSSAPPAGPEEEFTDERLDQGLPGRRLPRPAPAVGRRDLTIATVNNNDMIRMQRLSKVFEESHPTSR